LTWYRSVKLNIVLAVEGLVAMPVPMSTIATASASCSEQAVVPGRPLDREHGARRGVVRL